MCPKVNDITYQTQFPKEHELMQDDILFLKHIAELTDEDSPWHLVVDHTSDAPTSVPVVRVRVYHSSDEPVVDLTIPLESSYPLFDPSDYESFVKFRQSRLKAAVAMLRVFAINNHVDGES